MSITKPFTFVAGTKARANEVNQNFDVLYSQVNSNISAINTNANDIDTLDSNKANVNGSSSQRFACADPTSPSDAVNKQSLNKAIGNSINYIDGYVISKDSGSPNDTILVTAGSCYDYTKSVVLAKDTSTTKQNTSQGASTTYYVYVIGNDSGTSIDILISPSAVTPALPEGYTKFRQIGSYTTDGNNKIQNIINNSNSISIATLFNSMSLDWANKVDLTMTAFNSYTATYPCVYMSSSAQGAGTAGNCLFFCNGQLSGLISKQDGYLQNVSIYLPLNVGDYIYWDRIPQWMAFQYIIPLKGGN